MRFKIHVPKLVVPENLKRISRSIFVFLLALPALTFFGLDYLKTKNELSVVTNKIQNFQSNLDEELFVDHLKTTENLALNSSLGELQKEIEQLTLDKTNSQTISSKATTVYNEYASFLALIDRNKKDKLDTTSAEEKAKGWGSLLLSKSFDQILTEIKEQDAVLEDAYQKYLASLPKPEPKISSGDYSYTTVSTERGNFGVYLIKVPLSSVKVVTATANADNCKNGCPTKTLEQHIKDNGGYAGMNGSYFCPPDYAECANKVNSTDFAVYKSSSNKWLNSKALGWSDTGLATFKGTSSKFYKKSTDYGGESVTAGISNYPTLLENGNIVVNNDKLTSYQKNVKGLRGAIGVGNTNLYLALIQSATTMDEAYVMRALGAKDALNLDGGGSSAMYINGGYIVGPGRGLPNAIVLVK